MRMWMWMRLLKLESVGQLAINRNAKRGLGFSGRQRTAFKTALGEQASNSMMKKIFVKKMDIIHGCPPR